jgi:hypothetical protein
MTDPIADADHWHCAVSMPDKGDPYVVALAVTPERTFSKAAKWLTDDEMEALYLPTPPPTMIAVLPCLGQGEENCQVTALMYRDAVAARLQEVTVLSPEWMTI